MCQSRVTVMATVALIALFGAITANRNQPSEVSNLNGSRRIINAADFTSLQAALDKLPPDGGVVRFPPGTFEIHEPLKLSCGDVLIEGHATATHIKNVNEEGKPSLVIQPPEGKETVWRVRLANFRLTGNPSSGHGIVARSVDEIFLQGLTVSYHGGHGVLLDHCYEDPRISDSLITYNKSTGLALVGCHDIVVSANQFEENRDALSCVDGFNLCMTGNNLDDHLRHGVVIENTYGSVVAGNMIEECKGTAIILDRDCYGISVSANVIAHNFGGGIDLRDAHGCAISANTLTIVPRRAVAIGSSSGRITVSANNFSDSYVGEGEKRAADDQGASGIVLGSTADITLSGNTFSGLDRQAIELEKEARPRRILVSGNVLSDVDGPPKIDNSRISNNLHEP